MIYEPTMNIFDLIYEKKLINKKIRLIELFAGIGSQAKALEKLNCEFEHYKTCEWAFNSIVAYNHIHIKDFTDYSKDLSKEELIEYLNGNISTDYNAPCDCTKKPISWLRNAYNSCIANNNLMNIMKVKGEDLDDVSSTITANPQRATIDNGNLIIVPQWSESQVKMISPEGNVKRYIDSDIVDEFKEGQAADISFPKGYGKGNRVYDVCPTLTVAGSTPIVKVKDKKGNEIPLYKNTKQLKETIENSELKKGEPLNLYLYNRSTSLESQTLTDPKHNSQRLFDGLRIRKLTPKECIRLMGFDDKDYESMKQANLSDSAIYHCAGDSIVVNVLENIFKEMITNS